MFTGETVEVDRADEEWCTRWVCPDCNTVFATPYWARQREVKTGIRLHMPEYLVALMDAQHRTQTACLSKRRLTVEPATWDADKGKYVVKVCGKRTGRWMDGKGRIHAT